MLIDTNRLNEMIEYAENKNFASETKKISKNLSGGLCKNIGNNGIGFLMYAIEELMKKKLYYEDLINKKQISDQLF